MTTVNQMSGVDELPDTSAVQKSTVKGKWRSVYFLIYTVKRFEKGKRIWKNFFD